MNRISRLFVFSAMLFGLIASAHGGELKVTTYTAPDSGFSVNSHLIAGDRDAVLVDAQFLLGEAANAVEFVRASGKNLKYIVVTHGHPDHFFGLQVLRDAFPNARIIATADVIADIAAYAPKAIAAWKPVFKDQVPDDFITPAPANTTSLFIEGKEIQLIAAGEAEAAHTTVLWIPGSRALLAGDLVFGNVHLWLAENRPQQWLSVLDRLEALKPVAVYPGHGAAGGTELIVANRKYIRDFIAATAAPATREQAIAALKTAHSDYGLPVIVDYSVGGRLAK